MSHQRYPSHDAVKEPHLVSLKVLRLSRPSLVAQYPLQPPFSDPSSHPPPIPASLAYSPSNGTPTTTTDAPPPPPPTNPAPFLLTPILNLPPAFGSAYVGETFSCTLCANHDIPPSAAEGAAAAAVGSSNNHNKTIRDVRIEAEMKTPSSPAPTKLVLLPNTTTTTTTTTETDGGDLPPSTSLQRILAFDLKEEGPHVLGVTVSYYEASALSGRTRTFRKLYQFVCKPSLIVRTKPGQLTPSPNGQKRWVLEAQLENCGEEGVVLEQVGLEVERGLSWEGGWNEWGVGRRPVLQPGETEQVCFVVGEEGEEGEGKAEEVEGRVVFGVLQIGWRSEMGNRGFLSTGKLGTRVGKAAATRG